MSNNNTDDTVAKLHATIFIATRQAHSALISSNETIIGIDNFVDGSCEDADDDNNNTRKGQEVGIALFGTDQKYKDQLQDQFQNKLCEVEKELAEIQQGLQQQDNLHDEMGSSDDVNNNNSMTSSSTEEGNFSSINNVAQLQSHVVFLQQCSKVHKLLEDVDTLSLQTNFAMSSIINGSGNSGGNKTRNGGGGDVAFPFYPSSICSSPLEFNKFTFDSPESSTGSGGEKISPMVKAAQLVNQAEGILNKVMHDLNDQCNAENNGVDKENNNESGNTKSSHILQMQIKMLTELQHQSRRKKMELRHRAITLVEGCVVVEKDALIVRGSNTCEMKSTNNNDKKKTVAFDVVESPISTSTPTNDNDSSPSPPPSPLSDAYQILHLFSDDNIPNFGESLDGAMKRLSTKLLNVIQTCLAGVEAQSSDMKMKGDDKGVSYYKLTEESLRKGIGSNRRYDPVTIKGPAVQLQWCLVPLGDGESRERDITKLESVVTSNEINEETLQSLATVSPSMATFIGILNFLTRFLNFIHQHVLVGRSDLAQMLGKHLFGIYPLPNTSIASGSVMLSGVLLGAAAQGIEDGEEMPLMTDMVTAMKKYCIPKESSSKVWQMLHSMKQCLVKEISNFEAKLVELDMMTDKTTTKSAKTSASTKTTTRSSSSPTGLSVLLNNDGVGSPINPNATLSNLSNLDTTFPEAQHAATKAVGADRDNMKILSPLSELANSLGQAYVEGQRVYILNQGRSILLNTDYHNTCQVGTFVPEVNEPGSLSSLDDDPLKILFAFHQCAISTTALSIMELCRKTMDDATDHELASSEFVEDSLPPMLYRVSRELMDLFRAIIPTRHASEIASIPRMAAVLHNDCVYFAHEAALLGESKEVIIRVCLCRLFQVNFLYAMKHFLSFIGAEYKVKFFNLYSDSGADSESKSNTRLLGEVCSFMDMIPPFRDLATKSMGAMLEVQKGQLYELGKI